MRKYIILFFLVFPFLTACNPTPAGIIKPDAMAAVLTEIHIVDGSMLNMMQSPDTLYKYGTGRYLQVFNKFHTDSAQFRKSFKYYTTKPTELATIYDQVTKSLQLKSDSINKLLSKQNTLEMHKPALPAAIPSGHPFGTGNVTPGHPVQPQNMSMNGRMNFERSKAIRDSMIKKFKKNNKNALPPK